MEERGLPPAPEGGEASLLLRLVSGLERAGQQARPGDRGDRRDGGEYGFAAVFAAAALKPAATAGELAGELNAGRRCHAVEDDDDRWPLLGYRARDAVEQVLHEQQTIGRRGCIRPCGVLAGELGVEPGAAVPGPLPQGRVDVGERSALGPCRRGRSRRGRGLPRPRSGSSGSSFRPVSRLVPRVPRASEQAARHRRPRGSRCRDPACGRARGSRRMPPRRRRAPPESVRASPVR